MWNTRDNGETRQVHGEGVVAVAVDKEKSSQYAFKWAIDNLFPRSRPLKLIHVVHRSQSNPGVAGNSEIVTQQEPDHQALQILLPYRCFCTRRKVQFETVILYSSDVARALLDYVSLGGVDTLILGTLSRNGLSSLRIFKNSDVSSSVLKSAPNFCNVYIIYKGKVSAMRPASRSAQAIHAVERNQTIYHNATQSDPDMLYDEVSVVENDNPHARLSTDSDYLSFYENLESGGLVGSSSSSEILNGNFEPLFSSSKTASVDTMNDFSCGEGPLFSLDSMEDEVLRHKLEHKHAMELYHAACREVKSSNQKVIELQDWNLKQEQRLKEAESENARCKTDIEVAKRLVVQEMENKVLRAEMKAMIEADERKKVLDALRQSQNFIKYQTLFHSLIVLFLLYMYFSSA
ncbi:U-box domain-containing protein 52 isoform X1 [Lotus japonicus]|uniref:U-box domain-containing protein 52 isoform X1 n=1 Tax=Lotus japonicus TaxID=34305 RepID=UPI00258FF3D9|nr:U-box domain-containing protein 52 isoform X1 [Lotus japonicus]